jgi:hypothetical protein
MTEGKEVFDEEITRGLEGKFDRIFELLKSDKDFRIKKDKEKNFEDPETKQDLWNRFLNGRMKRHPKLPETKTDDAYLDVLINYYGFDEDSRKHLDDVHKKAMASENIVGDLLERYLAEKLEPDGWVWCSGAIVRAVDFIKYDKENDKYIKLQIKNRDNSENSSSKAIRDGTDIEHWFRTFSHKEGKNWGAFPHKEEAKNLSEEGFRDFLTAYIKKIK